MRAAVDEVRHTICALKAPDHRSMFARRVRTMCPYRITPDAGENARRACHALYPKIRSTLWLRQRTQTPERSPVDIEVSSTPPDVALLLFLHPLWNTVLFLWTHITLPSASTPCHLFSRLTGSVTLLTQRARLL